MAYQINYSDANKGTITIEDRTVDTSTSLQLPGRQSSSYGANIAKNFLHLLENFSNISPPEQPVQGQLWYDNGDAEQQIDQRLKIFDGSHWVPAGGVIKSLTEPSTGISAGDLWADIENSQLYVYTGTRWALVGPSYAEGVATGSYPETVVGTDDRDHDVIFIDIRGQTVAAISSHTFTPKSAIQGFAEFRTGINLSTHSLNAQGIPQYHGLSEKSLALSVPASNNTFETVNASKFMRTDKPNDTEQRIDIVNDQGLRIGQTRELKLYIDNGIAVLDYDISSANRLDIGIQNSSVISITAFEKFVGINNLTPSHVLDVQGNLRIRPNPSMTGQNGQLIITSTAESNTLSTGSFITNGGVGIAKNLRVGGKTFLTDLTLSGSVIPSSETTTFGDTSNRIHEIHATTIVGTTLRGRLEGSLSGTATTATRLSENTVFSLAGDLFAPNVSFNGTQGAVTLQATARSSIISSKQLLDEIQTSDELLINRGDELHKTTAKNFIDLVPVTTPVGAIILHSGFENDPDRIPDGWLRCNGGFYRQDEYSDLFTTIRYKFKLQTEVEAEKGETGWFAVPNMTSITPALFNYIIYTGKLQLQDSD